jgi:hypothetical protein
MFSLKPEERTAMPSENGPARIADGDIAVREELRGGSSVFVVRVVPGPDQYSLRSREEAISQALAFAARFRSRVWILDPSGQQRLLTPDVSRRPFTQTSPEILERVRGQFLEMPGLQLTARQIERLCGVEADVCQAVLDTLVETKFLLLKRDRLYARPVEH